MLNDNTTLRHVDFSNNEFNYTDCEIIADAL